MKCKNIEGTGAIPICQVNLKEHAENWTEEWFLTLPRIEGRMGGWCSQTDLLQKTLVNDSTIPADEAACSLCTVYFENCMYFRS